MHSSSHPFAYASGKLPNNRLESLVVEFGCRVWLSRVWLSSLVVRRDWNFLGNAGRNHQGSFILTEGLAAFLTKFQFRLTTKLSSRYNPNDVSKVVSGYMGKYVPGFDVTGSLPTTVDASLETLRSGGLDATFSSVVSLLQDKASSWPERANYKGGAMLRPVINNPYGACAEMAVWIGLFGAGVFTTTFFGCTVGEEFIILCPALAVISTTLGFVKIITLVLC
jgi:hypothetical protein